MANQYFNFYYSPTRQGFDSSTWQTLFGNPNVSNNDLVLKNSSIVHYGDILRGDARFNLNMSAPAAFKSRKFGFLQPNKNAYAYFSVDGAVLTANCSNGSTTTSTVIDWQSAWTNTDIEFRVKWEAGMVSFYIGTVGTAVLQAVISDASVSGSPMSLYVENATSDNLNINYIDVLSIQSLVTVVGNEDSVFVQKNVLSNEGINITESVSVTRI